MGVFISADTLVPSPLAPQTLNRYAYVSGNPLRYQDPTGHMLCADCDGGGGGYRTRSEPRVSWPSPFGFTPPAWPQPPVVRTPGRSTMLPAAPARSAPVGPGRTVAPPASYDGPIMRAGGFQADNGVFLIYQVPGYFRPRIETVYYSVGGALPVASGGVEHRHVTTLRGVFNWSVYETYDEIAGSGALGPVGGEVTTNPRGTSVAPVLGLDRGLVLTLQPGQVMVGVTNPLGPGGLRIGAEFRLRQNRFVVTSYGTLMTAGGADLFGRGVVHKDALLVSRTYFSGGGGVSGFERAQGAVRWSVVGAIAEVVR